jgi:hypothetical protein
LEVGKEEDTLRAYKHLIEKGTNLTYRNFERDRTWKPDSISHRLATLAIQKIKEIDMA